MKKILVSVIVLAVVYLAARPFVNITIDNGIAGLSARSSQEHKFETVFVWRR